MPPCAIYRYLDLDGYVPFDAWLRTLAGSGSLRMYRPPLYFFAGEGVAVIAQGCTKEYEVGNADIDRAARRRLNYLASPLAHSAPPA